MSWADITGSTTLLTQGDVLKITVSMGVLPFTKPTSGEVKSYLEGFATDWQVESVEDVTPVLTSIGAEYSIIGTVQASGLPLQELCAALLNTLNKWNTWSPVVEKVEINVGFRPTDLVPSSKTAIILVSIAVIFLVSYLVLRRVT